MTGQYNGVKTLLQQVNSQSLFIWTFDHVLNLLIMEACGSCIASKSLFGVLEKLYAFFSQSKTCSDGLEEKQKASKISQIHLPQRVSTTRWWSHHKALDNLFFTQKGHLFDFFIDTLQECQSQTQRNETITDMFICVKDENKTLTFKFLQKRLTRFCNLDQKQKGGDPPKV